MPSASVGICRCVAIFDNYQQNLYIMNMIVIPKSYVLVYRPEEAQWFLVFWVLLPYFGCYIITLHIEEPVYELPHKPEAIQGPTKKSQKWRTAILFWTCCINRGGPIKFRRLPGTLIGQWASYRRVHLWRNMYTLYKYEQVNNHRSTNIEG